MICSTDPKRNPKGRTKNTRFKALISLIVSLNLLCVSEAYYIYTFAGNGTNGYSGDNGPATSAEIRKPSKVGVSSNGGVYISDRDNNRVRLIFSNGKIVTFAGNGVAGYSGDGGPATRAQLYRPSGVAVRSDNVVFISDYFNNRIRVVYTNGTIYTYAGNGTAGYSGDGGPAIDGSLWLPLGITLTSTGDLFIVDYQNNRIRVVYNNGTLETFAGNGMPGYSGDGGPAIESSLYFPRSVSVSSSGEVYIADTYNNRIRIVFTNGTISTFAGNGFAGYSGDGGLPRDASLYYPSGVTTSNFGDIFIADYGNSCIRAVFGNTYITTIAGNTIQGYSGDGGQAIQPVLIIQLV